MRTPNAIGPTIRDDGTGPAAHEQVALVTQDRIGLVHRV
jgi:hypothetical protein